MHSIGSYVLVEWKMEQNEPSSIPLTPYRLGMGRLGARYLRARKEMFD